jgi:hypothetical protein
LVTWLVIPSIWLGVWILATALLAWDVTNGNSPEVASLGWMPTLIASVATSLYLSNRRSLQEPVACFEFNVAAVSVAVLFASTQFFLGGWLNALVAAFILGAGEVQRVLIRSSLATPKQVPVPAATPTIASPAVADNHPTNDRPTIDHPTISRPTIAPSAMLQPTILQPAFDLASPPVNAEADEIELDEDSEGTDGNWVQQMTRTNCEPPADDAETNGLVRWERVEWFYRHSWKSSELQVDLHLVYQPAFAQKPTLNAEVVEGSGQVSIGDSLAHGTRVQLKRLSAENADEFAVIWVAAVGPVAY